jgi:hypothetical protein
MPNTMSKIGGIDKITNHDYIDMNNENTALEQLYDNFIKADSYVATLQKKDFFDYKITKINMISQIPKPEITDSYYFPHEIQKYVDDNASYVIHYSATIKNRNVNLYFTMFHELSAHEIQSMNECVYMIYMWVFIANIYATKSCSKTFTLYAYLTPFKKMLPNNQLTTLNTEHVNTAYTSGCRENTEIVIFRKEEWFKVFIHETFHNFGLDFSNMNMRNVDSELNTIFNVNVEYKLYESYCETWARIINVMFHTYNKMHNNGTTNTLKEQTPNNIDKFELLFKKDMKRECIHSMTQSLKILHFMNLNHKMVTSKTQTSVNICNHLYKEKTAVFTYYIITGLLVNNYIEFMNWCFVHNPSVLLFHKSQDNIESYIELIRRSKDDKHIRKNIVKIEKLLLSMSDDNNLSVTDLETIMSLRMSITDVL